MIPKIIHQMGPENRENWHPIWQECQQSWKEQFPEPFYQHVFWTDTTLRDLVKNDYPEFLQVYDDFPIEAFRIDFSRFCILHKYGGIYADLDFYCYKNFYKELTDEIYLLESRRDWGGELVQNSLMASCPQHEFWTCAMKESQKSFYTEPEGNRFPKGVDYFYKFGENIEELCEIVKRTAGPNLISKVYTQHKVSLFPNKEYHPFDHDSFYRGGYEKSKVYYDRIKYKYVVNDNIKCRHFLSGIWGKEVRMISPDRMKMEKELYENQLRRFHWNL